MTVNETGKQFIKDHEGYRLTVYDDGYGNLTVGYGHKVVSSDNLKAGDTITATQALAFLNSDISKVEAKINTHPKVSKMTQNMYNAIASLLFNVGTSPITDTSNDLYIVMNKNATYTKPFSDSVIDEVVVAFTYTKANGVRVQGLVNRRNDELNMFLETEDVEYITM